MKSKFIIGALYLLVFGSMILGTSSSIIAGEISELPSSAIKTYREYKFYGPVVIVANHGNYVEIRTTDDDLVGYLGTENWNTNANDRELAVLLGASGAYPDSAYLDSYSLRLSGLDQVLSSASGSVEIKTTRDGIEIGDFSYLIMSQDPRHDP